MTSVATLREYLTTPTPASRRQAALQRYWLAWRRFRGNPTAMVGLAIILVIVLVAATNDIEDLKPLMPHANHAMATIGRGQVEYIKAARG